MIKFKSEVLNNLKSYIVKCYLDSPSRLSSSDLEMLKMGCAGASATILMEEKEFIFLVMCEILKEMLDDALENTSEGNTVN